MSAANYQVFVWSNGQVVRNTSSLTPLYTGVGVSDDGSDNGYTITQDAGGGFNMNSKKLVAVAAGSASGQVLTWDQIGANNGIAPLDSSGKVPVANLPAAVFVYQGTWDPATNTPMLVDGTGTTGYVYWVDTAYSGTVSGLNNASMTNFMVGDLVVYNGSQWELTTPAAGVQSVNGYTGAVVLTTTDIAEGTNLYFTEARVLATTLTGFSSYGSSSALSSSDSILTAFEKLEYRLTLDDAKVSYTGSQAQSDLEGGGDYAIVTQIIASGDTQFAPSADAVFTALQGVSANYAEFTNDAGAMVSTTQVAYEDPSTPGSALLAYGAPSYASYTGTIAGTSTPVTLTANNPGTIGNSIDLMFDGSTTINSEITTWNTNNPSNQVTLTTGSGTQTPSASSSAQLMGGEAASSLNDGTLFLMVKDATIANTAEGNYYMPGRGAVVDGFTGLTLNSPVYLTSAGGYTQTAPSSMAGNSVVSLGYPLTATSIVFEPEFLFLVGT